MTEAELPLPMTRRNDVRVTAAISAAHFVAHFYYLVLPPLFDVIRRDYGVSYTELGFALIAFNVLTGVVQTPAGFLVDRIGARIVLIAGLVFGATGFAVAGIVDSFWVLVAMFALAGIGNAVYHPADYAVLAKQVSPERVGQAFSIHTFAGMLGSGLAPVVILFLYGWLGWRGAFVASAILGLLVAGVLVLQRDAPVESHAGAAEKGAGPSWQLLLSPVILMNFGFFALLSFVNSGLQNYSVVAFAALHETPLAIGNAALTGYLLLGALGVLIGGMLIGRTNPGLVTSACMVLFAGIAALLAVADLGSIGLMLAMSIAGLANGVVMPSRDMIVREVTPPGSFGKVFGFVTTGFNFAGVVAPFVFGALMDHGYASGVFLASAAGCLLAIATVVTVRSRRAA
jgi:MFS family permease